MELVALYFLSQSCALRRGTRRGRLRGGNLADLMSGPPGEKLLPFIGGQISSGKFAGALFPGLDVYVP